MVKGLRKLFSFAFLPFSNKCHDPFILEDLNHLQTITVREKPAFKGKLLHSGLLWVFWYLSLKHLVVAKREELTLVRNACLPF